MSLLCELEKRSIDTSKANFIWFIISFISKCKISDCHSFEGTPCLEWKGTPNNSGYGRFCLTRNYIMRAHRASWEFFVGSIPDGLVLDHLCRNEICVNVLHLEPVTIGTNTRRGKHCWKSGLRKIPDCCTHGHKYPENLYWTSRHTIECRVCKNISTKKSRKRIKLLC